MADITLARVVGDWRRIVGDRVTSHETAGLGFGVTGTVTLIPHLGDKSQGVPGAPNALYTAERLECKVLWGLLHDAGHNNQWQDVAVAVDGSRIVWEAHFDLEYKDRPDKPAQKLELLPARFGPEQVVGGEVNVAALSGALVEYPPAVVGLAQAASADAIAAADRAEAAANGFDLTASSSTLAPGAAATVTVSGDGPAYSLAFGVPQGPKGDTGDPGEVTTSALNTALAGKADLVGGQVPTSQLPSVALSKPSPVADRAEMLALTAEEGDVAVVTAGADKGTYMLSSGPPTAFSSWVKLATPDAPVQAVNGQTGTVNLNAANVGARPDSYVPGWSEVTGKPATFPPAAHSHAWDEVTSKPTTFPPTAHTHPVSDVDGLQAALGDKAASSHTHPVTDLTATGTASSSTYLRGDGSWATPTDTTYSVPTQAEAEAGTATTGRAFSAQRVAQGAIAASGKKDWQGTQAQYDALGTKEADRTYWIV
jgi:hypothetical protein